MIIGQEVILRPVHLAERRMVYEWLAHSDVTSSMMGPPTYPDAPIPSWEEFCTDYPESFFGPWKEEPGKLFIIVKDNEDIGAAGYDLLDREKGHAILDIWLKAEKYCGHGFGSAALNTLCTFLSITCKISSFFICPSARNKRACAAYLKAGFKIIDRAGHEAVNEFHPIDIFDYEDNLIMKKIISNDELFHLDGSRQS